MKALLLKPKPTPWLGFYLCLHCRSVFEVDETDTYAEREYHPTLILNYLNRDCPNCGKRETGSIINTLVLMKISEEEAIQRLEAASEANT